jgi:hypothetical protein
MLGSLRTSSQNLPPCRDRPEVECLRGSREHQPRKTIAGSGPLRRLADKAPPLIEDTRSHIDYDHYLRVIGCLHGVPFSVPLRPLPVDQTRGFPPRVLLEQVVALLPLLVSRINRFGLNRAMLTFGQPSLLVHQWISQSMSFRREMCADAVVSVDRPRNISDGPAGCGLTHRRELPSAVKYLPDGRATRKRSVADLLPERSLSRYTDGMSFESLSPEEIAAVWGTSGSPDGALKPSRKGGGGVAYLKFSGWLRSANAGRAMDRYGEPIPWYTYAAIYFLGPRISPTMRVFEYGCGQSTLWWAKRVKEVVSVENQLPWARQMPDLPNAKIIPKYTAEGYAAEITKHGKFDIVVIDGEARIACARHTLDCLTEDGVVIWDNAENPVYVEGKAILAERGFRDIPFDGLGPVLNWRWTTSVLYRDKNCLGI